MADTPLDEQQQEVVEQDQTQVDPATQDTGDDEYFLTVDDRTRYRTAEDAQKAFKEAGERIATLSAWDKAVGSQYDADPEQVAAALEDYIKIKAEQAKAATAAGKQQSAETHTDDVQLTPKEQDALKWLKKIGPQLGYVPKTELEEVKSALAELKAGNESYAQAQLATQEAAGQGTLNSLIKANKLPEDPKFSAFVENSVAAWVNQSQKRVETWHRGGAAAQDLLKQGFEYVMNDGLNFLRNGKGTTTYQGKNLGTTTGTVRRLPQVGSKLGTARPQQRQTAKPTAKEIHEAAWAAANKRWTGTSGDSGE
jgi:hypothetical protein